MYANVVRRWVTVAAALLLLVEWTGVSFAQDEKPAQPKAKDLLGTVKDAPNLKTFCKLVELAELNALLEGKSAHTLFAPTDEAFKKLGKELDELQKPENKAKLQKVLKHHLVVSAKKAADLKPLKSAKTLAGDELKLSVKDDALMVEHAKVVKADIEASNGILHVIDAVLMPAEKPAEKPAP